jgi:surfactin synthase thioesterase subunit
MEKSESPESPAANPSMAGNRIHRILAYAHAGSSCAYYWSWKRHLERDFEIVPMELPGRGSRFGSPLPARMDELVEDAFRRLCGLPLAGCYSLFGHSLGGLLVFELAHRIREAGFEPPRHLFISGRGAPHLRESAPITSASGLKQIISALGEAASEVFDNPVLAEAFLPVLESDLRLIAGYRYRAGRESLRIPITVVCGKQDHIRAETLRGWSRHTTETFALRMLEGDHFYVKRGGAEICRIMMDTLRKEAIWNRH